MQSKSDLQTPKTQCHAHISNTLREFHIQTSWTDPIQISPTQIYKATFNVKGDIYRRSDMEKGADNIRWNLRELWKFLDCGRLFTLIVNGNHVNCESFFYNIRYLSYNSLWTKICTIILSIWRYFEIFICGNFYC